MKHGNLAGRKCRIRVVFFEEVTQLSTLFTEQRRQSSTTIPFLLRNCVSTKATSQKLKKPLIISHPPKFSIWKSPTPPPNSHTSSSPPSPSNPTSNKVASYQIQTIRFPSVSHSPTIAARILSRNRKSNSTYSHVVTKSVRPLIVVLNIPNVILVVLFHVCQSQYSTDFSTPRMIAMHHLCSLEPKETLFLLSSNLHFKMKDSPLTEEKSISPTQRSPPRAPRPYTYALPETAEH